MALCGIRIAEKDDWNDVIENGNEGGITLNDIVMTVSVAEDALPFLDGATLDFVRDGFKETFRVDNPNAKSTCGCGESFGV